MLRTGDPRVPSPPIPTDEDPLPGLRGTPVPFHPRRVPGGPWENILIRTPNWVGDAVMALPALRAVRAAYPKARITLWSKPNLLKIFDGEPYHDEGIPFRARGIGELWRAGREISGRGFDLALNFPHSISSILALRFARIPVRVGYSERWWDPPGLLTHPIHAPRQGTLRQVPQIDYYLDLTRAVGCEPTSRRIAFRIPKEMQDASEEFYRRVGVAPDERVIGVSPGASFGMSKIWPPAHFAAVADTLAREHDARVLILCGPGEEDVADAVESAMETQPINTSRDIVPLDLLKPVVGRMMLLVSTDSGTRHFAVGTGVPVVVVMGSTYHVYTETEYEKYEIVHHRLECWPCHKSVCPLGHHKCMRDLTPEPVLEAARRLLRRYPPGKPGGAADTRGETR